MSTLNQSMNRMQLTAHAATDQLLTVNVNFQYILLTPYNSLNIYINTPTILFM
jgi:hypothetical protein